MRYLFAIACLTASLAFMGCQTDDGKNANRDSGIAKTGQDLIVDIGVCRVEVSSAAIGPGAGQLPAGSKLSLRVIADASGNRMPFSPTVRILATDSAGAALTGLNLSPPARILLHYDFALVADEGIPTGDLLFLSVESSGTTELSYNGTAAVPDTQFTLASRGRAEALFTEFSTVLVSGGGSGGTGQPTALSGTISTVLTSTIFQLSDSGANVSATMAIPTADTTTVPNLLILNDASFDAGNPTDPNNRILNVTVGGTTYTTDDASAGVTVSLNAFSGSSSSGTMVGTVAESGGSATLAINYTFTTGAAGALALTGTVNDVFGIRTLTLQDGLSVVNVTILMPDTFPNLALDPITFDDASFDAGNPTDPNNRIVTVTEGSETFSSDVPIASVIVTFTSFDAVTGDSAGTITGTAISATPSIKTLDYTFTTTGGGGGGGTFTAGTEVDITTSQAAVESAIVYDGFDYVGAWLSDVGTSNRIVRVLEISTSLTGIGAATDYEPAAPMEANGGFGAAVDSVFDNLTVVGASGPSAATDTVVIMGIDYFDNPGSFTEFTYTGTNPMVTYNAQADLFVVAWQTGAGISFVTMAADGSVIVTGPTAVLAGTTLTGLAAAGGSNDEVLITADDASGIVGQYVTPSTGAASGSVFDISTDLSGGVAVWDEVGGQYLVTTQATIVITVQQVISLPVGSTTPNSNVLQLLALNAVSLAGGGDVGVIMTDALSTFYAMDSDAATGPASIGNPIDGNAAGIDFDTTVNGPPLANDGAGGYVALAALGAGGVKAVPFTVVP